MNLTEQVLLHTLNYIITTIPVFILTIFTMSLLTFGGYVNKISWVARPLMKFGHLHESLGLVFITAFASPSAASAMLRSLNENGLISRKEVIIAVLSNAFPVMIMESRSLLPVMISFLGSTGLIIFGILITILAAKVLASIFFAVRHSTPYYIGIFGSGLGLRITILNTLFRNCIDIGTIVILKLLF